MLKIKVLINTVPKPKMKNNYRRSRSIIIRKGVDETANIVKLTYGAKGRNVIVARPHMLPYITKDGVTVAKEAMLDDEIANIGAYLIKQVAARTDDGVHDGTTSSTILGAVTRV